MKTTTAFWHPWSDPGLEHLQITHTSSGIIAKGVIVRILNATGFHATYQITADFHWPLELRSRKIRSNNSSLHLSSADECPSRASTLHSPSARKGQGCLSVRGVSGFYSRAFCGQRPFSCGLPRNISSRFSLGVFRLYM